MYNNMWLLDFTAGSGTSSGQRFHLCRKCANIVYEQFLDFIDKIRRNEV